jgi:tetratricopeptide (TPR) repeat protein
MSAASCTWAGFLVLMLGLSPLGCGSDPQQIREDTNDTGPVAAAARAQRASVRGERKVAVEILAKALVAHPGSREDLCPPYRLAVRRAGAWREWLAFGACANPPDAADHRTTWLAQAATGGAEQAAAALRAALVDTPDDATHLATLAAVHWLAGEAAAAHLLAGRALARVVDTEAGVEVWQLALEVRARAAAVVAPAEANGAFERAVAGDSRSPVALAWAAFLLHHARVDEAEARLSAWLSEQPDDPEARALRDALVAARAVVGDAAADAPAGASTEGAETALDAARQAKPKAPTGNAKPARRGAP